MLWALGSVFIRSGLIMAAAAALRSLSPNSGAYRHRILACAFAFLLLWPVFSAVLPEIPLSVWPFRSEAIVTVTQTVRAVGTPQTSPSGTHWAALAWLFGVLASLSPLLAGCIRVYRITRAARPIEAPHWHAILKRECDRLQLNNIPELLLSSTSVVPFACGVFGRRIVLPSACLEWPDTTWRIVLAHELLHVQRRDLLWQVVATLTTAIWWFQPLCWLNRRNLRRDSETACDNWVIESGIRASDYATELLKLAKTIREWQPGSAATAAIARCGELERRIRALLNSPSVACKKFPTVKVAVVSALTISVSAVTVSPGANDFQGGPYMKRTVITGLFASAGLIATNVNAGSLPSRNPSDNNSKTAIAVRQDEQDRPIRVGGELEQAKLIHKVTPTYPPSAKAAGVQGMVRLDVTISKEGVPEDIRVISSPSDDLTQSAVEAVRQWRYGTTLLNGRPVAVIAEVHVNYTLAK
jgi:TonB family protein